jgi:large subunit ribosomal protein L29
MKASELRDMDDRELRTRESELRKEVFGLRFSSATGELDNTAGLGHARRDLARVLTVARERSLSGTQPQAQMQAGAPGGQPDHDN